MLKNILIIAAVVTGLSLPLAAQAGESRIAPTDFEKLARQQQLEILTLKHDNEEMAQEIQRLQDQVRELNETLDKIRAQAGGDTPHPN